MDKTRKDYDVRNQSNMHQSGRDSVLGSKESFEHGSGGDSEMTRGMGSSGERSQGGDDSPFTGSGDSKKKQVRSLEDLPAPGWKMEER